jgi:hypothetical protein
LIKEKNFKNRQLIAKFRKILQVVQSLCWWGILIYRPVSICKRWSLVRNLAMSCLFLKFKILPKGGGGREGMC